MMKTFIGLAGAAMLLAACSPKTAETDKTEGPVVSTSEAPRNEAVDTSPATAEAGQTPGANSYTEGQAKGAIEAGGYTGVSALTQGPDGIWQGTATKDGKPVSVSVDYKGVVTAK